jgi:hypothetical protein
MNASLWRIFWIALPFVIAAWFFKKPVKRDPKFDPLQWAIVSGSIVTAMLLSMFCIPFLSTAIWEIRRVWWSCVGAMPSTIWMVLAGAALGAAYGKMNGGSMHGARWVTTAPLALWLFVAPPQSDLVEMSRFASPRWKDDVCLQSTGFTCTPSAAATLLKVYDVPATETEMAAKCETTRYGTHVLGLARGLAAKLPEGKFNVRACRMVPGELRRVQLPCITFTCCHAWVIFKILPGGDLEIGEALGGRRHVAWNEFATSFSGEAVLITPLDGTKYAAMATRGTEITSGNTDVSRLILAGSFDQEIDGNGRTLVRFGSAPIDVLKAQTESEGW